MPSPAGREDVPPQIKAVTFDFWGTLFEWHGHLAEVRGRAVRDFVARHRAELSPQVVDAAFAAGIARQDVAWRKASVFGPAAIIEHFLAELRLEAPPESRAELQRIIEDPVPERVLTPIAGVEDAISRLRVRDIPLGIVCDSGMMVGRVLRGQLQRTGLARHFEQEALAFSDEVGVTKPRPEIFRKALAGLGADPADAAHIGDLRFTDMAGARALGMRAVRFRGFNDDTGEGPEGDVAIDSYTDLDAALGFN
ncbi:MAG: HAD family hydrolase [Candidatus Dormibacteraeota bacterium]|nr:HAD family hydrolase [Candidatus Dormibacteraeota bacterium]